MVVDACFASTLAHVCHTEFFRAYLKQLREALGTRLVARCYADGASLPSKYWLAFANRGPTPRVA